ncbi:MAG: hypothetical protein B7Z08_09100 [Sphingomonadales bacterium 32-68-7]|nr:MAG: hypothetical protein B7Z33_04355 [Sphingomonadales bacterium 12-68-11]OYX08520.1 MAG: hypothetical protein B7Z08_09100 [Sphingomonadales bacterium 32-68-7]
MLGPISKSAKALLGRAGFELVRPSYLQRTLLRSAFSDWFSRDIDAFAAVYRANRETLATVPAWLPAGDLSDTLWRYGVPEPWESDQAALNQTGLNQIEREPTYTDLIVVLAKALGGSVQYLEIGVSVGKNFLQVCRALPDAKIVGLDIEKVNPVLAAQFASETKAWSSGIEQRVETLRGGPDSGRVELAHYELARPGHEPVRYARGDQFSADTWASLKGHRFNLIFSDGVHSAEAVLRELDFLIDNDLIATDAPFAMYWDDLVSHDMQGAFATNVERLKQHFGGRGTAALYRIHGTYGAQRINGLFTTLPLG